MDESYGYTGDRVSPQRGVQWQADSATSRAPGARRRAWLRPLDFLEEQIWGLRDRIDALRSRSLPESLSMDLAVIDDDVSEAALLLRRPTPSNHRRVAAAIGELRAMLDTVEAADVRLYPQDGGERR